MIDFYEEKLRWKAKLEKIEAEADEFGRLGQHSARIRSEDEARIVRRHVERLEQLNKAP